MIDIETTAIGLLMALACSWAVIGHRGWLASILPVAAVLQGASSLNLWSPAGVFGLTAYNLAAGYCALGVVLEFSRAPRLALPSVHPALRWLGAYAALAIAGALVLPWVFAGLPVLTPLDQYGLHAEPVPLGFSMSNVAQALNLSAHVVVMAYLWLLSRRIEVLRRLCAGLLAAFFLCLAAGSYERLSHALGGLPLWPVLLNNPSYVQITSSNPFSIPGFGVPFSEPSYAGTFFAIVASGCAAVCLWRPWSPRWALGMLLALAGVINTLSSTGMVTTAVMLGSLSVVAWIPRAGGSASPPGVRRRWLGWFGFAELLVVVALSVAMATGAMESLVRAFEVAFLDKVSTVSYVNRLRADAIGLALLGDSYGLGVGMGSHRGSSFVVTLLACTGVAGLALLGAGFARILTRLVSYAPTDRHALFCLGAVPAACIAVSFGVPDLNAPFFWIFIMLAVLPPRGEG